MSYDDFTTKAVRSSAILTGSYVAGTTIDGGEGSTGNGVHELNQLNLYIDFTIGSLTSAEIKIEFSTDGENWYQEVFESISGGTATVTAAIHSLTATGKYRLPQPMKDRYIKVSAIGTGTATSSLLKIDAVMGNV